MELYGVGMVKRKRAINVSIAQPVHAATRAGIALTLRDLAILDTLTLRVKVLSVAQVARWLWDSGSSRCTAARRLRQLVQAGLLEAASLLSGPEIDLLGPLVSWRPGECEPVWGAVLRQTRTRWVGNVTCVRCIVATPAAASRFGVTARPPRISETTHDLHVAQVFLRLRSTAPQLTRRWEGEVQRQHTNTRAAKVPDAILRSAGRPTAIEIVGASYGAEKLSAFHAFCESDNLNYELW